jgi:hypothetical protein
VGAQILARGRGPVRPWRDHAAAVTHGESELTFYGRDLVFVTGPEYLYLTTNLDPNQGFICKI